MEHIREIVFQCTADGDILLLNTSWMDTFGYTVKESLGYSIFDFALNEDVHLVRRMFDPSVISRARGAKWQA